MDRTRSSHALLAGGAFLAAIAAAAVRPATTLGAVPTCGGVQATIVGTPWEDVLIGTPGRDVIVGRGGFDEIHGGGGDDLICGAVDHLSDRIRFDGDTIYGGSGDDRIYGGAEEDVIFGGPGDDHISGGADNDDINPGPGADRVSGNGSSDVLSYRHATAGVRVDLATGIATGEGRDTIDGIEFVFGSRFADVIYGDDAELNILNGEAGDDRIYGRGGRDVIEGRGGDDLLVGGAGPEWDRLDGGSGHDTCISGHADGCED